MSRDIRDTIEINASPATVWTTFTDTASFPTWNPSIHRADGELRQHAKLDVQIEPPGGRAMSFKPTVLTIEPERELRFTTAEHFTGLLVPLFGGTLDKTQKGFEQMNAALKARAEAAER